MLEGAGAGAGYITDFLMVYLIQFNVSEPPVMMSPIYQFILIISILISNLHQSFCKLNYGNRKHLWKKEKYITFGITATLEPLSGYHNLI